MKVCIKCLVEKCESDFYFRKDIQKYRNECILCFQELRVEYRIRNKHKLSLKHKEYYKANEERLSSYRKQYYLNNKEKERESNNKYKKQRRKNDALFKLREVFSASINRALRINFGSKEGQSCIKFLPYTIQQLKEHLEKQFEPWMSWENHGRFSPDKLTWQIDHIIPHSDFHYVSMDCEEFQKCWALENLRPLLAKDNMEKSNKRY